MDILKDNRFARGLAAAQAKLKAFGAAVAGLGAKMLAMDAAQLALFGLAARHFSKMGSDLLDMSDRTGVSVEALSEFGFAAGQTGASIEDVETAIGKMQKTIAGADEESKKAVETLGKLGIAVNDLDGMTPEEQFAKLAGLISEIEDPAKRTAAAMEVFGKSGRKLIPMMRDLEALRQGARDSGLVFSREDALKADEFGDKMDAVWSQLKMGVGVIGGAVVPAIEKVVSAITQAMTAVIRWLKENEDLVEHMFLMTAAFVAFDIVVFAVGKVLWGVGVVLGIVTAALGALVAAVSFLLTPLGAVVAALGVLAVHLVSTSEVAAESFGAIGDAARLAFGGIADAIKAGNWQLAMKIALAGLKFAFGEAIIALKSLWEDFLAWFEDQWEHRVFATSRLMVDLLTPSSDHANKLKDQLREMEEGEKKGRKALRDAEREAELAPLRREREAALKQLEEMANRAAAELGLKRAGGPAAMLIGGALAGTKELPAARLEHVSESMKNIARSGVRGTFESNQSLLTRAFGFGTDRVEDEQLKEQKAIRKGVEKVAAAAAAGNMVFWK